VRLGKKMLSNIILKNVSRKTFLNIDRDSLKLLSIQNDHHHICTIGYNCISRNVSSIGQLYCQH